MKLAQWLDACNKTDPMTNKVYVCENYVNCERILEQLSAEHIVIGLERYTVADLARHILEISQEYMDSRINVISLSDGSEIIRHIISERGIAYFDKEDGNACKEIFNTLCEMRMNGISSDMLSGDSKRINALRNIRSAYGYELESRGLYDSARLIKEAGDLIKSGGAELSGISFAYDQEITEDKLTARLLSLLDEPVIIDNNACMTETQYHENLSAIASQAELWKNYGVNNEVERTIIDIVHSGYDFCDTAVLCPDEQYVEQFRSMCSYYNVPVVFPNGISCKHTDVYALLSAMVKWCKGDLRFDLFRDVMLSPIFHIKECDGNGNAYPKAAIYSDTAMSGNGWGAEWYGTRKWQVFKDIHDVFAKQTVNAAEFYGSILELFNKYIYGNNAEQRASVASVKDALYERYTFYKAYDKSFSLSQAMSEIAELAENARYMPVTEGGAVTCCSMGQYCAVYAKNIYVLGMTAGRSPVPQSESPILNDSEKEKLFGSRERCSDAIERRKLTDLVRTLLFAKREKLVLSCAVFDSAELRAQSPSAVFNIIAAEKKLDIDMIPVYDYLSDKCASSVRSEITANSRQLENAANSEDHSFDVQVSEKLKNAFDKSRGRRVSQLDAMCGGISAEDTHFTITATSLAEMMQCPLKYFYRRIAYIEENYQVELDAGSWLRANAKGNYVHTILERYVREVLKGKTAAEISKQADRQVLGRICGEVTANYLRDHPPVNENVANREKTDHCEHIAKYLDELHNEICSGKREVLEVECEFGGDIKIGEYSVTVKGKIDRLDKIIEGENVSYQVVDYKTGSQELFVNDLENDPQDYIYALALKNGLTPLGTVTNIANAEYVFVLEDGNIHVPALANDTAMEKSITDTFDKVYTHGFVKCRTKKNTINKSCKFCPAYGKLCTGGVCE